MNKFDLKGEVAIITGGAQGIGFACAKRFVQSGAKVCLWDIDNDLLKEAKAEIGSGCFTYRVDITKIKQVERAAEKIANRLGKISILVNSAGITGPNTTLEEYPVDDWHQVMELNVGGTFHTCRTVVSYMKQANYGRIVNIASIAGKEGNPNASAYSTSKAAVIGMTKSLGKELADHEIAVNCITPAAAKTRIFDQMTQEHIDFMLSKVPRARFVKVEEIASMITWMVSRENSYTTAGVFDISGGRATY